MKEFEPIKLDKETTDGTVRNLDALYQLFPSCFTEAQDAISGKMRRVVDWGKLRELLGEYVEDGEPEKYDFTWVGKRAAQREAAAPCRKTLRPCPEESVDWDTTQNLYIEGDNLEVLKLLQNSYMGKVKMIYIDPPYNTGNDFVYHDDFAQSVDEYDEHNLDDEGNRYRKNTDSNGRFHSDWCSMIYTRLMVARNLLTEDGVIFIHIDEHEVYTLQQICKEVFGEYNELGTIIWDKRNPKGSVVGVAYQHESILVFCKNKVAFAQVTFAKDKENAPTMLAKVRELIKTYGGVTEQAKSEYKKWLKEKEKDLSGGERAYSLIDSSGKIYQPVSMAAPDKPETRSHRPLIHPITGKPCPVPAKGWRYKDDAMDALLCKNKIEFGKDETTQPRQKYYLEENMLEAVSSLLYYGGSDDALGLPFDNPKPVYVAKKIIKTVDSNSTEDNTILDFFSGSATTAHAVMQLNAEDSGNRKFIMVQLPEETAEDSEAFKAGYKNICEIGKERIRRAGKKIKADSPLTTQDLDIGFRVLKCDESNYKPVAFAPKDYTQESLDMFLDNIKEERTGLDLLFDCMMRWGLELSLPYTTQKVDGCTIYNVDDGNLVACFDGVVTSAVIDAIADTHPLRVVFRDSSFTEAAQKMNLFELFKQKCGWTDQEVQNNVRVI